MVTRSVFSTLTTFQPSVGSFGLNRVRGFRRQPHPRSRSRRDVCSLAANRQLGPGVDLANLGYGSLVKRCRSFVLTGDQLYGPLVVLVARLGWWLWVFGASAGIKIWFVYVLSTRVRLISLVTDLFFDSGSQPVWLSARYELHLSPAQGEMNVGVIGKS